MPLPRDVRPTVMRFRAHVIGVGRRRAGRTVARNVQLLHVARARDRLSTVRLPLELTRFLENVINRRPVPRQRLALMAALRARLTAMRYPWRSSYTPLRDFEYILRYQNARRPPAGRPVMFRLRD